MLLHDPLTRLLAQIVAIVIVSRLIAAFARRVGAPSVVGDIVAGVALGPSLFGWALPTLHSALFAPESLPTLQVVSRVGRLLFMFLVGLELDPRLLRGRAASSVAVAHAGIALPFALGSTVAWLAYPHIATAGLELASFVVFVGAASSVTGFPVVARLLSERRWLREPFGQTTLAVAFVDDVTAWCIVGAAVVATTAPHSLAGPVPVVFLVAAYVAVMIALVRPLLVQVDRRVSTAEGLGSSVIAGMVALVCASSWATGEIGIHALFGAFFAGVIVPKQGRLAHALAQKLEDLVLYALLPVFLLYSGLQTDLRALADPAHVALAGSLFVASAAGKIFGSAGAARLTGLSWRDAGALAALMNTRGIVQLIVLNIGLENGALSPDLFSVLVATMLASALTTGPLLALLRPVPVESIVPLERREPSAFRVLVCVGSGRTAPGLVSVAASLQGRSAARHSIEALHLVDPSDRPSFVLEQEGDAADDTVLNALKERARELDVAVEPTSFVSTAPAADIRRIARVKRADLVLLGWHRPVVSQTLLGGIVYDVMRDATSTVGVFVDRGFRTVRRALVPHRGSPHDRAALDVARRLHLQSGAEIVVISAAQHDQRAAAREAVEAVFGAGGPAVAFVDASDADPIEGVLRESAAGYDVVIVGVGDAWGLQPRRIGAHPERLLRDCPVSILIVRGPAA